MKKISIKNIIVLLLSIVLIIVGFITFSGNGFEKSIEYKAGTRIEVYIPQGYEKSDIINIANDSFENKNFIFQEVEKLNQIASIKITEYTEEEIKKFKDGISEKYNIELEKMEVHEIKLPETEIITLINPYIMPILLVTLFSLVYVFLKNLKKENNLKDVLKMLLVLILILASYFSLILILRLPFGSYTMPFALVIYAVTLMLGLKK